MDKLPPYIMLEKAVGQTPLQVVESWRLTQGEAYKNIPLAYAGRLDPMASGKLLILLADECKAQEQYHNLDKTYEFSVLFGLKSDSGDVLGLLNESGSRILNYEEIKQASDSLIGDFTFPYPVFSAKTVLGKPLHTWAVEGRLSEIEIPTRKSIVYDLQLIDSKTLPRAEVVANAQNKIESIPPVTDPRKALGNDFRRPDIRKCWEQVLNKGEPSDLFTIASFTATVSSGTYIRSLAEEIARILNTTGLAFSIHRTEIGVFSAKTKSWTKKF